MEPIDISYWKPKQITEIAKGLLEKVSDKSWHWELQHHRGSDNSDGESFSQPYWTLEGSSKRHQLSIVTYPGNVPWITRWKLYFTKDGKKYAVLEEIFSKFPELKELGIKLDSIGRRLKRKRDAEAQRQIRDARRQYKRKQNREAEECVASMRGK